jgi:membrane protease subunit HflK
MEAARNEPPPRETLNPAADGYVLTADANIIHVRAALRYRITDPIQFIFAFRDAPDFVTNALNNALFFAGAQFRVDDALTRNVTAFSERIGARVNQLAEQQRLGIAVEQVAITSVIPPRQLTDRFRAVLDASVRRDRQLNEALTYANEVVSRAKGEAASRAAMAQSDRARLVEAVSAEAQRFKELLPKYRENPELFMRLRQADTFQRVLTNAEEKIFLNTRADGKPVELRLQLSRELQKPKPTPPPVAEDRH